MEMGRMIPASMNALSAALLLSVPTAVMSQDVVPNGGFEDGAASWSLEPAADFAEVRIIEDPFAPDGNRLLLFDHRRTRTSKAVHDGFQLEPYSFYHFTFWIKAGPDYNRVGPGMQVNLSVKGGGTGTRFQEASLSPEEWRYMNMQFVTGPDGRASLVLTLNSTAGRVWIDHLKVSLGKHTGYPRIPLRPGKANSDLFYDEFSVSSKIPSRIVLRARENLPKGLWQQTGRFFIELPKGVRFLGEYGKAHTGTEETIEGGGTRYVFDFKHHEDSPRYYAVHLFALADDSTVDGKHATSWVEWEGGKETPYKVPIKYIDIPAVAQPKEIVTGVAAAGKMKETYPDYFGMLKSMGFNAVDFWKRGQGAEYIEDFLAHGIDVDAEHSGFSDLRGLVSEIPDFGSITLDGKRSGAIDASHRGKAFEIFLDELEDLVAKGFSCIIIDDEHYGDHTMNTCLCDRCKDRWGGWLSEHRAQLKVVDPQVFLDDPLGYPDHFDAWWFFRANLVTEWYEAAAEHIDACIEKYGSRSSVEPWFATYTGAVGLSNIKDNFLNVAETGQVFDRIMPMYYSGGFALRREIRKLIRAAGREVSYASLNMGEARADRRMWKPGENRAHILETLFAGGRGYMYWAWNKSNIRIIAEVAETNGIVAEHEDLFLNGQNTERFWTEQPRTFATTLETGDAGLLLVSNYTGTKNTRIRVFKRPDKAMTLTEVYTGKTVELARNQQVFSLLVPSAQCRLWRWEK